MSGNLKIWVDVPPLGFGFVLMWIAAGMAVVLVTSFAFTFSGMAITDSILPDPPTADEGASYAGLVGVVMASILALPITALTAGLLQWLVLRWSFPWAGRWFVATFLGLLVGIVAGLGVGRGALGWGILGAIMGLAQWLVIWRSLPDAYWWILASTLGLALGRLLVPGSLAVSGVVLSGLPGLLLQILGPVLVWTILTGLTLRALSRRAAPASRS